MPPHHQPQFLSGRAGTDRRIASDLQGWLAVAVLLWPACAGADTHAQTSGQVHAVGSPVTVADSRDGVGATPASSSVQASQGDGNTRGQIKARASAQVGRLEVISSALGGTVGPSSNDSAGARASSSDLLRIDAGINLAG